LIHLSIGARHGPQNPVDAGQCRSPPECNDHQRTDHEAGTAMTAKTIERNTQPAWFLIFAAWLIVAVATLGALFFGEVMKVPTCTLCWYQRIFMFPLALILPLGLFPYDRRIVRYALPLAACGWGIALFHVLLVGGVIPESVQPCTQGVPCSQTFVRYFGFVTIPLLALVAFSATIVLLAAAHYKDRP
jgi:disulfide bond formation protein DsbB